METKSFQEAERFVEDTLEQSNRISTARKNMTEVRNRFMRGAATREEVFLALNDASTYMTILESLHLRASIVSCSIMCFKMEESLRNSILGKLESREEEVLNQEKKPARNLTVIHGGKPEKDDQQDRTTPRSRSSNLRTYQRPDFLPAGDPEADNLDPSSMRQDRKQRTRSRRGTTTGRK